MCSGEDLIEKYLSLTCILGLLMPGQLQTLMSMAEVQLLVEQSWPVTVHVHSRVTEGKAVV